MPGRSCVAAIMNKVNSSVSAYAMRRKTLSLTGAAGFGPGFNPGLRLSTDADFPAHIPGDAPHSGGIGFRGTALVVLGVSELGVRLQLPENAAFFPVRRALDGRALVGHGDES